MLLKNQIDITRVPFSDRGSRLLVYRQAAKSRLCVKLAERLLTLDPHIEAYLKRPPLIDNLCLTDDKGRVLDFQTVTSPDVISLRTSIGDFELAFQDENTLAIGLPNNARCGVRMEVAAKRYQAPGPAGAENIRGVIHRSNARIVRDEAMDTPDGYQLDYQVKSESDSCILLHIGQGRATASELLPFSKIRADARARWAAWFDAAPPVAEAYREKYAYAWWVMGNNLIHPLGFVTREAMLPTKAFYVGVWLWDSALHAIAFRHANIELARDQLRVMLAHQLPDGMLPDAVFDEGVVSEISHPIHARVTKPPILAWAALKLHESHPDLNFLEEVYPPLVRFNNWWFGMNDDDSDGLVQYTHPYSSGLDDSPLWDHGLPVESPDINTYLSVQMDCLGAMAEALGKADEARMWRTRSQALTERMIASMWNEQTGFFDALRNETPIPVHTPFNLLPLWTSKLPDGIKTKIIAHLKNKAEFGGEFALPTVARNDPAYAPEVMWRGPVWANVNYFFVEALQKAGENDLARELRDKTLNIIMSQPGIHEYYSAENGKPPLHAAPLFGWTASVFIELALQSAAEAGDARATL